MLQALGRLAQALDADVAQGVGADVLAEEFEITPELSAKVVEIASERAKVVAEEQAREKEEAERLKAEEEQAAAAIFGGDSAPSESSEQVEVDADADAAAAAILGGGPDISVAPTEETAPATSESAEDTTSA